MAHLTLSYLGVAAHLRAGDHVLFFSEVLATDAHLFCLNAKRAILIVSSFRVGITSNALRLSIV